MMRCFTRPVFNGLQGSDLTPTEPAFSFWDAVDAFENGVAPHPTKNKEHDTPLDLEEWGENDNKPLININSGVTPPMRIYHS